ncbi:MAG: NADP oxidoreductase [Planctomycetota bacterium]
MKEANPRKVTLATVWLDGCSGCHMSFLDMDERLVELAQHVELVYSPIVDVKHPPTGTDVGLIEGAVSNEEDAAKARMMRGACGFLISLGDCAVTGNVPSMRNVFELGTVYDRAFRETADLQPQTPGQNVPPLLPKVLPVHEVVPVDLHLPGCPPPADAIYEVLTELIAGRTPDPLRLSRFGR